MKKTLKNNVFENITTYCISSRIKSNKNKNAVSNTRGLLYLTSGYALSKSLNSNHLTFCENGGQLLDVLLDSNVYIRSRATKNTNIRYLSLIEKMLKKFDNDNFTLNYIFKNNTKSEIITNYLDDSLISKAWSCYNLRLSNMCGSCWNCFITHMSLLTLRYIPSTNMFNENPLLNDLNSSLFKSNQNIIYDLLTFYYKLLKNERKTITLLEQFSIDFENPQLLSRNFALDIFLGIQNCIKKSLTNGLGKKALEYLEKIDKDELQERSNFLLKLTN
jgi:hypothetical protein